MRAKTQLLYIVCAVAFVCASVALAMFFGKDTKQYGHISVYVVDAYTLVPLKNATIVLPDCGITTSSDKRGVALVSSIPIDMDSDFIRLTGASYGETTMIIYADGYLPCVWLKVHLHPSRIRNGPTIYMFPKDSEVVPVTVFSEAPDDTLMQDFVERHRPP